MRRIVLLLSAIAVLWLPSFSWARAGGGCLAEGTPVLTPFGRAAIETLKPGDKVWSLREGRLREAQVHVHREIIAGEILEILAGGETLRLTPEHPVMTGPGEFRMVNGLKKGDSVCLVRDGLPEFFPVQSLRRLTGGGRAYHLLVTPGGTFVAGGLVVHNKGCFLPDSPVLKPDGTEIAISAVQPGDELLAYTPEGRLVRTEVRKIVRHEAEEYLLLKTDRQTLRVTEDHPFYVGNGSFRTLEGLRIGDPLVAWDGRSLSEQRIVSLEKVCERVPVFNLQTDRPNTFFVGRLAVHNKGGCFAAGTRIATPCGTALIEDLAPGDEVLGITGDGRAVRTAVKGLVLARGRILRIDTDYQTLMVTEEHPVGLWEGGFEEAGRLRPRDRIRQWKDGRPSMSTVLGMRAVPEERLVFNLQVSRPHTFLAENTWVHNKGGGCFPAGTLIRTPAGQKAIETLVPGDRVLALDPEGRFVHSQVESVFAAASRVFVVNTDRGFLRTTEDHPLALGGGAFLPAGDLDPGDRLQVFINGSLVRARVHATSREEHTTEVFNLTVTHPHTFFAADFVVHNKGGSYRSSSRSRSGDGDQYSSTLTPEDALFAMIVFLLLPTVFVLILYFMLRGRTKAKSENLDFRFSTGEVARKAAKTEKLLEFISRQDEAFLPDRLRSLVQSTFLKVQECWQARDYTPVQALLMQALFAQQSAQVKSMVRNHEINRLEDLKVERIDLVNVRYTEKKDQREFTALISASAKDIYVDDRTGKFLRGDRSRATFQEFWTFQQSGDQWLLREIEQAGESDILKDENFAEMLTEETLRGIYQESATEGTSGPWLAKGEEKKATRIERLLNFLVQTDKLWNRQHMLERARQVFLGVYLALESGDPVQVPETDLFPELAESLRKKIKEFEADGLKAEWRNLCVRKAELILVRNYKDSSRDEFMVRIDAHAQKVLRRGDRIFSGQEYVMPFEEYLTFGRRDERWKLKEILPSGRGKKMVGGENVDEESSPGQVEWYYRQPRAT